jgi:eukaryotic-like serine/threonine-protein kinase
MDEERWRQVWDAFEVASKLPVGQRAAYAGSAISDAEARGRLLAILSQHDAISIENGAPEVPPAVEAAAAISPRQEWGRVGQTLGRFVVDGPLGRGGMGEVYRARDTELNRTVALKFLSSADIGNPASVTRFLREAQAASALNHPGIVTVYDVLRDGSTIGIVMELIDGVPLRALCGKAHPPAQVANWGRQIATALAAAHASGIVHRDVKPENLMVRPDGYVKVLDFGLARFTNGNTLNSVTSAIAGTLRYMSPEQVHGEAPKPAGDIFTLGIVLYELATGVHPFAPASPDTRHTPGRTPAKPASAPHSDSLMAPYLITTRKPRLASEVESTVPSELSSLLAEMLEKDPALRPSAASVADRLLAICGSSNSTGKRHWLRERIRANAYRAVTVFGLCILIGSVIYLRGRKPPSAPLPPTIVEGIPLTGAPGNETNPAFSPDGRQIAYAWDGGGTNTQRSIYVRLVDGGNPLRLTSGSDDDNPVWSPDASKLAFLRYSPEAAQVVVVPALGGANTVLLTVADARRTGRKLLAWSSDPDELIVADRPEESGPGRRLSLYALRVTSGQKRQLTNPPEGMDDMAPIFSPDGRKLAFLRRHGALYAIHVLDALAGKSRQLAAEVNVLGLAWSADSRSLIFCTDASPPRRMQVVSETGGEPFPTTFQFGSAMQSLVLSPASGRMAFVHEQKDRNIWALTKPERSFRRLIASTRSDEDPRVSPDGRRIAFTSNRSGAYEIWVCERDGSNPRPVTSHRTFAGSTAWSPDGSTLAYDAALNGPTQVWLVNVNGGPSRTLMNPPLPGFIPNWSADGAWIYFVGKGLQIWKARPTGGSAVQVTRQGGFEGFETFDGKYFYFVRKVDSTGIWRVPVAGGEEELLPELASVRPFRSWDMAKDGIYFAEARPKPILKFYRFRDRKTLPVADLPMPPRQSERGLSVSPDGSLILYVQIDSIRSEILMAQTPR